MLSGRHGFIGIHPGSFGFWPILKEAGWSGCQEYGPVLGGFGPVTSPVCFRFSAGEVGKVTMAPLSGCAGVK